MSNFGFIEAKQGNTFRIVHTLHFESLKYSLGIPETVSSEDSSSSSYKSSSFSRIAFIKIRTLFDNSIIARRGTLCVYRRPSASLRKPWTNYILQRPPIFIKSLTEKFLPLFSFLCIKQNGKWKPHRRRQRQRPRLSQQVKAALVTLFMTRLDISSLHYKTCSSPTLPLKSC